MIENKMDKRIKNAKNYKVSKKALNNNTKEQFAHLFYASNESYVLLYTMLECIYFAIKNNECTDVKEVAEFISKYKDECNIYPKVEFNLD